MRAGVLGWATRVSVLFLMRSHALEHARSLTAACGVKVRANSWGWRRGSSWSAPLIFQALHAQLSPSLSPLHRFPSSSSPEGGGVLGSAHSPRHLSWDGRVGCVEEGKQLCGPWRVRGMSVRERGSAVDEEGELGRVIRALAEGRGRASAVRDGAREGAGIDELRALLEGVRSWEAGTGPRIARLLEDSQVTDVLVNSTAVWVDRGGALEQVAVDLGAEKDVRRLAIQMAAACGKRLDDASPIVDGSLPGGVRLHAVLPGPSASGTLISLRTSRAVGMSVTELEKSGSLPPPFATFVRACVARRANVLVSGATGSGKTTLLSALLGLVPPQERIVCIEEVPELKPRHPHVVSLHERRPNVQGAGAIPLSELVRAAMRMRPDRLVLGECRGPEVRDVLLALNTGHDGGWATIHANGSREVPARLVALGALAGMSEAAVSAQAVAAFDAVVHMSRLKLKSESVRRVCEIAVLRREGVELHADIAVESQCPGRVTFGPAWERFVEVVGATCAQRGREEVGVGE